MSVPNDPNVAVAILYERLGHVIEKVDALSLKIDRQSAHRDSIMTELEHRVEKIEEQVNRTKWFLAGVAAGGGLLGGTVAGMVAGMVARSFGGGG